MSFETWHNYGYGIMIDDITTDTGKILNLLDKAPKFKENFLGWIKESYDRDINDVDYDEMMEYEDDPGYRGLGPILSGVIQEAEDIEFLLCDDYDGHQYLLYPETYPWCLSEKERNFTEQDVKDIFEKYLTVLTNDSVLIDYMTCENGG